MLKPEVGLPSLPASAYDKVGKQGIMNQVCEHNRGRSRQESGFTLLELIITVSIIGILAALVAPTYLDTQAQAQYTVSKSNMTEIKQGIVNHFFNGVFAGQSGEFPPEPSDNQMTYDWANTTVLFNGRTVAQLYNNDQIIYNPQGSPYLYYLLPESGMEDAGFKIEDPDFGIELQFRP